MSQHRHHEGQQAGHQDADWSQDGNRQQGGGSRGGPQHEQQGASGRGSRSDQHSQYTGQGSQYGASQGGGSSGGGFQPGSGPQGGQPGQYGGQFGNPYGRDDGSQAVGRAFGAPSDNASGYDTSGHYGDDRREPWSGPSSFDQPPAQGGRGVERQWGPSHAGGQGHQGGRGAGYQEDWGPGERQVSSHAHEPRFGNEYPGGFRGEREDAQRGFSGYRGQGRDRWGHHDAPQQPYYGGGTGNQGGYGASGPIGQGFSPQGHWSNDDVGTSPGHRFNQGGQGGFQRDPSNWRQGSQGGPYASGRSEDFAHQAYGQRDVHHDPHYLHWRNEQLRRFDDDYRQFNQERFDQFSNDFNDWRSRRQGASGSENPNRQIGSHGTGSAAASHDTGEPGHRQTQASAGTLNAADQKQGKLDEAGSGASGSASSASPTSPTSSASKTPR